MRKLKLIMLLTVAVALPATMVRMEAASVVSIAHSGAEVGQQKGKKNETVVFVVKDKDLCEKCKAQIEKHVGFEKGVKKLTVDLKAETVTIQYDPAKTTSSVLQKKLTALGYPSTPKPAGK